LPCRLTRSLSNILDRWIEPDSLEESDRRITLTDAGALFLDRAGEVIPRLPKFLSAHPLLHVEMSVSDERQNLVAEGADIAIRLGRIEDSVFGARKLATLERVLVAAPSYLKARGMPRTPADLAAHDCIFGPGGFGRDSWTFVRNGTVTTVDVKGRIHADSGPGVFTSGRSRNRDGLDGDVRT
jgi:DNA-binding transcriptional LysR family regulator